MAILFTGVGIANGGGVETATVTPPVTIELKLDSKLPAYDIAWSDHTSQACQALADQAVAEMDDPATPFVLKIADLPVVWRPLAASFSDVTARASASVGHSRRAARRRAPRLVSRNSLSDMTGAPIDRTKLNSGRIHYERDVETALLDILARIRDQRPGAMLSVESFVVPQSFGANADAYKKLQSSLDFVVLEMPKVVQVNHGVSALNRRSRARAMMMAKGVDFQSALKMANPPDGMWVAVDSDGEWTAVDDEPLPTEITDGSDENSTDWTNGDSSPSPSPAAPDASGGTVTGSSTGSNPPVFTDPNNSPTNTPDTPSADDGPSDPVDQSFGTDTNGSSNADPGATDAGDGDAAGDDSATGADDAAGDDSATGADDAAGDDSATGDDGAATGDDSATGDDGAATGDDTGAGDASDDGSTDSSSGGGQTTSGGGQTTSGGGTTSSTTPGAGPIIVPGAGFTSITPLPSPTGTGPGSNAVAIARWDVVPYQTFAGQFTVGVVAFHINGIDRVEFSANGGPWTPVYQMQLNPRTNVWEYFITLDANDFADGPVEVRAVAYPTVGVPRVLQGEVNASSYDASVLGVHSLPLFANAGGSLPAITKYIDPAGDNANTGDSPAAPYKTFFKALSKVGGGGTIVAAAGTYEELVNAPFAFGAQHRWVTIQPAAGVSRSQVVLNLNSAIPNLAGNRFHMVRFKNVSISIDQPNEVDNDLNMVWFDNAEVFSPLGWDSPSGLNGVFWIESGSLRYVTNGSFFHDIPSSGGAVSAFQLVRGLRLDTFRTDAFKDCLFILNSTAKHGRKLGAEHPDVWQLGGGQDNVGDRNLIVFGLEAMDNVSQQLFTDKGFENGAFVNILAVQSNDMQYLSQFSKPDVHRVYRHVIFYNITLPNSVLSWRYTPSGSYVYENILFEGVVAKMFGMPGGFGSGFRIKDSHSINGFGGGAADYFVGVNTTGPANFVNGSLNNYQATMSDYHLAPSSSLLSRIVTPPVPVGVFGDAIPAAGSVGAVQGNIGVSP